MRNFCAICGVHVRSISADPEPGLPIEDLEWHQELRAVRHVNSKNTTSLTGIGYLDISEIIVAPPDPGHSYRDVGATLESVLGGSARKVDEYSYLRPGHDFGGAARFQRPCGNPLQDMINAGYSDYAVEPSRFLSGDDILCCLESVADVAVQEAAAGASERKVAAADIFAKLPVEVVHILLSWLPSHDIPNLRLASRTVAFMSRTSSLPQSFWRSRFSPDFELGFALPADECGRPDWRSLYFATKHLLRNPHKSARLRNRKRVWEIICKNASLIALHLRGTKLHGLPITWDDLSGSGCQNPAEKARPGKIITTESMARHSEKLHVGSREIAVRRLLLHPEQQTICAVGVTTVIFNSQTFVSGLRVVFNDSTAGTYNGRPLGYVDSNSEHFLWVPPEENFAGLEVATCVNGIVAVRLILEAGPRRYSSAWVGDIGNGEPHIAFGKLLCPRSEIRSFDLAASFDAFKMISLAIIDIEYSDTVDGTSTVPERAGSQGLIPQPIWTPYYPGDASLVPMPRNVTYQAFNPILNIDFGGSGGETLPKLTRIVAHMGGLGAPFTGLMFEFDGQPPRLYGRQGRTEVSFPVDGARGERIAEVTYDRASTSIGIWSLKIRTNFGRCASFIPDELRTDRPGEPFPGPPYPTFEGKYYNDAYYSKETLRAPEGQVITGFTSILEASSGTFQTFGLQCYCVPDTTLSMPCCQGIAGEVAPSAAKLCSSVGSYLIGGGPSGCTAYTYASLDGVRRIRFSRGSAGRPRHGNEISGLWLDYSEPQPPAIVGQWLSEADSMDLEPDEKVIEVSIWMSKLDFVFNERFHRGRVIGVSVLTSRMQRKTVKSIESIESLPVEDYVELKFRASKLEKLASLVWAFNALWDHPRVLSSPNTDTDRIHLWDPRSYYSKFPWMAPEKIIREDTGFAGECDRIVAVTAYRTRIYGVKYITGLVFTYKSGVTRTVGYTHGEPSRKVSLGDNERISRLELLSGHCGVLEITLHCESLDGGYTPSEPRKLVNEPIVIPSPPTIFHDCIDLSGSQAKGCCVEKCSNPGLGAPKDLPVGLWGFNVAEGKLILGAVYAAKA
ncbi:hypothetical protein VTN00DRAFT_4769 [Thermoascus crustaceus]|uniref:uncharacterized protein n=1 Tax=Thermoascus crustaceus TaxID=5088 RepID=UPI00374334F9